MLCFYNSVYLILLFIQLSISLGNLPQYNKGIVPHIMKYWLLLSVSVFSLGTLQIVCFVFVLTINHLSSSLASQTFVDDNSDRQPSLKTSFLFSL